MPKEKINTQCSKCSGTGVEHVDSIVDGKVVHSDITCTTCAGSGKVSLLSLNGDLIDFLTDVKDKIDDIKQKADNIIDKLNE